MKQKQGKILDIYFQKLKYFNYSNNTVKIYNHYVSGFLDFTKKNYQHLTGNDFQFYLDNYNFSSISQQNQIISSIKFLYEKVLNKKYTKVDFKRPRKEKKLPLVIESEYLIKIISNIDNLKHKAILTLGFSCALRVSEVINLKIEDIDSKRMLINIRNAKGKKDRIVKLSVKLLETLRLYFKKYKPITYLFNGQTNLLYSASSCNKIVKKYLGKSYHFHTLRHSGATAMHEKGTDLALIQKLLGHNNIKTTMIYTHISQRAIQNVIMPI